MLYNYMFRLKIVLLFLVAGMFALNVAAGEAGHEHHQHHEHAASGDDDPHAHHRAMMNKPAEPAETTKVDLLDHTLVDQHGKDVKFVSDVIGDRIVVMDFIYTSCTTVCPVISAVFGQVQTKLGDELGDEVVLVSVSVDPARDTPQRLKAYAATHKAQPGWIWLTGASGLWTKCSMVSVPTPRTSRTIRPWCWLATAGPGNGRVSSVFRVLTGWWSR